MCVCVWEVSVEVSRTQHSIPDTATDALALFSGSCRGKEKRTWCTLFAIFLGNLHTTLLHENFRNFCLSSERHTTELWDTFGWIWSQKQYRFDGNCLHCFVQDYTFVNFKEKHCVNHVTVFSWNRCTWGNWACANSVYLFLFLCPHTRTWEQDYSNICIP